MAVGLVGSGPAAAAVEAALSDVDADVVAADVDSLVGMELAVAVGRVGDATLEGVNERALDAGLPWIAVELGGVGGYPVVDAAIAGFTPETGCYECLSGRVAANLDPEAEPTAAPAAHTARYAGAIAGREAARFQTDEADVFGTVVEVPYAERRVLPLPDCSCEEPTEPTLELTVRERTLEESLGRAERGLDERVGIVQQVGEAESFPAPYYLARGCDTTGFSDASAARDAAGVAAGWDAAFMKALGEGLERYCAGVYRLADLAEATAEDLDGTVPPDAFVCRQAPDGGEQLHWVDGRNLHTDERARVPAEFVHYPPRTERFRPAITTGLGLGNSGVEAVVAGLTEVLERDAAMLAWYSTFEAIELEVDDEAYRELADRARSEDLSVTALLLTQDVDLPVVAVAVERDSWPRLALGSSAGLDANVAARSALAEALQNWMELRGMGPEDADDAAGAIGDYAAEPAEASTFVDVETVASADTVGPRDIPGGDDALEKLLDRVATAGLTAYAVPVTTRDVAALGFDAVRVLVPGAQPLFFGEPYFGDRIDEIPVGLGFEPRPDRAHHPFP